jgi:hypothetical protein
MEVVVVVVAVAVAVGLSAQLETLGDRPYTALVGAGRVAIVAQAGPLHG